ncbi:MAG TPA: hypothetical protein VEZ90_03770, partial [Blastocatellia bacterium]|nr:hypothetical protein [Blastocatellia bacterium]
MSQKILGVPEITNDVSAWASLLEETDEEILASAEFTDDEKRRLLESGALPEGEGKAGTCLG